MKKRVMWMLCMVFCLAFTFTGCSLTRENPELAESKLVKESKEYVTNFWDADQRADQKAQYVDVIESQFGTIKEFREKYQEMGATEEQVEKVIAIYDDYMDYEKAKKTVINRTKLENKRYKKIYGVDMFDLSNYDFVVDSKNLSQQEVADAIWKAYKKFEKKHNSQKK